MKYTAYILCAVFVFTAALAVPQVSAVRTAAIPVVMEKSDKAATDTTSPSAAPAETASEYVLPYPGILPDHPLYFFKKLRDQILERLIADPMRKIEFYVLQSDKAINASIFLASQNKKQLAAQMVTASEGYKNQAVSVAKQVKSEGKEIPSYIVERLQKSFIKQIEVVSEAVTGAQGDAKTMMTTILEQLKKLQGEAGLLK